jgi:hypothetical protein
VVNVKSVGGQRYEAGVLPWKTIKPTTNLDVDVRVTAVVFGARISQLPCAWSGTRCPFFFFFFFSLLALCQSKSRCRGGPYAEPSCEHIHRMDLPVV